MCVCVCVPITPTKIRLAVEVFQEQPLKKFPPKNSFMTLTQKLTFSKLEKLSINITTGILTTSTYLKIPC